MFERFTERARQVVVLSQEESRTLKHNYIGTEHILLGLLREEEGLAARVLERLGVTVERVRTQVVRIVGYGEDVPSGQIPFTPRAKKVLELALREALGLGHDYIGTEHILLGLVRENEGVAARILLDFDADSEKVRTEVISMVSTGPPRGLARRAREADRGWLDFDPTDAFDLALRLAPLASRITFDVRSHLDEEEPTFRVSCRLRGKDDALRRLVALEAAGIRAVLDENGTIRLGRREPPTAPAPAPEVASEVAGSGEAASGEPNAGTGGSGEGASGEVDPGPA
jgi:Clp amino terminal domain, pathogenicity island component